MRCSRVIRKVPYCGDVLSFDVEHVLNSTNRKADAPHRSPSRDADELAYAVAWHRKRLHKKAPRPASWAINATTKAGQKKAA